MIPLEVFTEFFSGKHNIHPVQTQRLYYQLQSFSLTYPDNKKFIKEFKKLTSDFLTLTHQQNFEEISSLAGFTSYGQVKENGFLFYSLFNPMINQTVSSLWVSLDAALEGGFKKGELVTIGSGTNMGKSQVTVSLGSNFIRQGLKVLHINLEGRRDQSLIQYSSNLGKVAYRDIVEGRQEQMQTRLRKYEKLLKIRNMLGFGVNIKDLEDVVEEQRENFPFDVLIVDYGQLLSGTNPNARIQDQFREVFSRLKDIAVKYNVVVISPFQFTRRFLVQPIALIQELLNDIPESQNIVSVSDVVLALARPNEQVPENFQSNIHVVKRFGRAVDTNLNLNFDWVPQMSLFLEPRR